MFIFMNMLNVSTLCLQMSDAKVPVEVEFLVYVLSENINHKEEEI